MKFLQAIKNYIEIKTTVENKEEITFHVADLQESALGQ